MEVNPGFSDKAQKDFELVVQAQKGSQYAFTELMTRYREAIYFMILKMINNTSDAEDLTIEAFGKAFKNIEQYSPSFAFSTWLFKIASNNCIDFLRKKKARQLSIYNSSSEAENDSGNGINEETSLSIQSDMLDPEESLIKDQKKILLRELVDNLKPRYRQLVELRYFKEYSYEEIADELDIPIGTVKAQLFRARELLFGILKKRQSSF
ncbi:MAG: sigma-70 family RNA polymerase sigma factor [Salinivirgaceae bacterium]|jgi:RNA polymerase sigma factor (sigma-70 family)|nr:sigma-70 family RNA polymerase sigma factor [Salinivirgaceae bacterium]